MVPTKPKAGQERFTTGDVLCVTSLAKLEKSWELAVNHPTAGSKPVLKLP